jgi:predicted CoA-substrate-specific enzyme activase
MGDVYVGVDVGSTTTKLVVIDADGALLDHHYLRAHGQPRQTLLNASRTIPDRFPGATIRGIGLTGSGGEPISRVIGGLHVNELVAQARSVGEFHRGARTVIEIGGQDSKLLSLEWDENSRQMVLLDFAMNALCAAGTGSFLDQQAERLGISIEEEFARVALDSTSPARVAGRCTVFAKSDMIHLQQQGTPLADILAGLCQALARNFKTVIGKGKAIVPPVLFQGGVACNEAVVRAFETVFGLEPGELVVPQHHCIMPALGAAYTIMDEEREGRSHPFHGFEALEEAIRGRSRERSLPVLAPKPCASAPDSPALERNGRAVAAYLGVDVGSISTCLALVDGDDKVLTHRYLMTGGNPLEAVREGLQSLAPITRGAVEIRGVGVTGSGRYLTGHYIGADVIRNEITAQARAAAAIDPDVDTIIEIGGQDSKYIRMHRGAVVDFTMNNACAAGTGSFLEEQADKLSISVADDFARLAFSSPAPASLGERCTVFMESDLVHHQQRGASLPDLTAGLAYSIVNNYMNRVVNGREVGRHVFFQGGVASNASVASAFEQVLGKAVTVPEHNRVTGAIGAAILAREEMARHTQNRASRFQGFELSHREYEHTIYVCKACPNLCEIKKVTISGQPPMFSGARCEKFEEAGRGKAGGYADIPDLFAEREAMLLDGYTDPGPRLNGRQRVGIPRALIFYDLFPYWHALFDELGLDIVLSEPTNPRVVADTQNHAIVDSCFPVKLMYGHTIDLMNQDVDYIFLPSIIDRENIAPGQTQNNYCPLIPAAGQMMKAQLDIEGAGAKPLGLSVHMSNPHSMKKGLAGLARQLGLPAWRVRLAAEAGSLAQAAFYDRVGRRGAEVLAGLGPDQPAVVLVGRPYNSCDLGACMNLPLKLRKLGVLPLPIGYLPLSSVDITDEHPNMYWRGGQDILAAARIIREDDRLQAIYVTNFDCGPDSFLLSFFQRMLGAKPFLELELDDHTAEAGLVTRCEAFLDSLNLSGRV